MQHLMTPYSKPIPPWAWWDGAFTDSELDWLQSKAKNAELAGQVGSGKGGIVNPNVRRSQISWLHSSEDTKCWHQDYGFAISRKLSITVQLTDPSEYEGGNLQILTADEPANITRKRGMIALFPSYVLHQVTPVTRGSRQSLVAWVSGPAFK